MKKLIMILAVVGLIVSATGRVFAANWADPFTDSNDTLNPTWTHVDYLGGTGYNVAGGDYTLGPVTNGTGDDSIAGAYVADSFTDVRITAGIRLANDFDTSLMIVGRFNPSTGNGYDLLLNPAKDRMKLEKITAFDDNNIISRNDLPLQKNTSYNVYLSIIGQNLFAKVWKMGDPESGAWTLSTTDSSYPSGASGLLIEVDDGYTGHGTFTGNTDYGNTFASSAIPEPGTLFLLGSGLLGLVGLARKKKRGLTI